MSQPPRPIFRADAVRRYAASREKAVLPQVIAPRTFLWLWLVAALLIGGVALAWLTRMPLYASGQAIVLDPALYPPPTDDAVALVVLPPDALAQLRIGQPVIARAEPSSSPIRGSIIAVETIMSPAALQQRFAQTAGIAQVVDRPAAVALARLDLPADLPAPIYSGSRFQINVEVGSRPLLAFLPIFDQLFGA